MKTNAAANDERLQHHDETNAAVNDERLQHHDAINAAVTMKDCSITMKRTLQ